MTDIEKMWNEWIKSTLKRYIENECGEKLNSETTKIYSEFLTEERLSSYRNRFMRNKQSLTKCAQLLIGGFTWVRDDNGAELREKPTPKCDLCFHYTGEPSDSHCSNCDRVLGS
jgi:hypothetical protein